MPNGEDGSRSRRPRVLWFVFGGLAGVAAFGTVVLYWLVRRPHLEASKHPPISSVGTAAPSAPAEPAGPDRGVPPQEPSDSSCDVTCDDSCSDSCNSTANGVCDDLVRDACEEPMNDTCGSSGGCDPDLGCDPELGCESGTAGSQLLLMLTGGHLWLASTTPRSRERVTLPARLGVATIRGYQRYLSQALATRCRYSPSCSEYGVDALHKYGALDGAVVTLARIRRCTATVPFGTLDPA